MNRYEVTGRATVQHGLPRSNADKRLAAITLLKSEEWGQRSDREIGRFCGTDRETVGRLRRDTGGIIDRRIVKRNGANYVMYIGEIGRAGVKK